MFRQAALDRLSSPEGLDTLLQIESARAWLALVAILALVAGGVVWSVVGTIPLGVRAPAVLIQPGGVFSVRASGTGRVAAMLVKEGDVVRKGQPIATIDQPEQASALSPADGVVVEIAVDPGALLTAGASIASVHAGERNAGLQAVIYVPPTFDMSIVPGMPVQISLSSSPAEEFGFLLARVTAVSPVPATPVSMTRVLANAHLVEDLSRDGAPYAVYAALERDPASASGFRWSSPRGATLNVNSGTIGTARIVMRRQRPIELLMPWLARPAGN